MQKAGLILLFLLLYHVGNGQHKKTLLVKTNVLNIIFIPSIHAEYKIGKYSSLQANFHRGKVNIGEGIPEEILNTSIEYKRYGNRSKKENLTGFYYAVGAHLKHDYNTQYYKAPFVANLIKQNTYLGPQGKLGYQVSTTDNRIYFDGNVGLALIASQFKNNPDFTIGEIEGRISASVGVRLF